MKLKTALVTGGTRGIGFDICRMFLRNSYNVVFTGRNQETVDSAFERYVKLCPAYRDHIQGFVLDYTKPQTTVLPKISFDTIIHNAGMLSRDSLSTMNESRLGKMFQTNVMGPMAITKQCLPYMSKQNSGNIFMFCPPYKIDHKTRHLTPYMQTKLAQTTFMFSLADMLQTTNIKVGGFWTDYPIWTDALIHRKIGTRDNCMSPDIIAKTVELMMVDRRADVHGRVVVDREYLTRHGLDPKAWALGSDLKDLKNLDSLFLE
jgi:NADP-dependent 3-hydroxy acid dehydrogenase YdfG